MSKIIYVVVWHRGEYDEACSGNSIATHDKVKAEKYIADKMNWHNLRVICSAKVREFARQWGLDNPRPVYSGERKEAKRWPAGLKESEITVEMRQERNDVILFNQKLDEEHTILCDLWRNKEQEAKRQFVASLNISDGKVAESLVYNDYYDYNIPEYKIEELEVI